MLHGFKDGGESKDHSLLAIRAPLCEYLGTDTHPQRSESKFTKLLARRDSLKSLKSWLASWVYRKHGFFGGRKLSRLMHFYPLLYHFRNRELLVTSFLLCNIWRIFCDMIMNVESMYVHSYVFEVCASGRKGRKSTRRKHCLLSKDTDN